ncbi:MAG: helix-turn-helix transcriptional regulator [Spirochaetaceae bacterium]|jgi:DNA-binding XRE family transcriptional regulator|nr:helix-turn-helix transcriptional regulator [Spirochaetaceae bacterium]
MTTLDRIRVLRKTLNLRQDEFAKQLGLTQTTMSQIEVGRTALTEKNIKLICVTFNANEQWLRTGNGEMFGPSSPYERELLDIFGKLTLDTQEFVVEMARNLLKRQEKSQNP